MSAGRSRPVSELFDLRKTDLSGSSFRGNSSESGSLPRRMLQNGRQRLPIPFQFMAENNGAANGHGPGNSFYGQASRNCGSKV